MGLKKEMQLDLASCISFFLGVKFLIQLQIASIFVW